MTSATLVVRNIGMLATCDPGRGDAPGVIIGGALAAAGEHLIYVGDDAGVAEITRTPDCVEIDASRRAVVPGFVDAHTHIVWLGDRADEYDRRARGETYEAIARSGGGIRSTVRATASASVADLAAAARVRARAMLRGGTTTVEVKSGYGLETDAELRQLDAAHSLRRHDDVPDIVTTYLPFHAAPVGDRDAFMMSVLRDGLPKAADSDFIDAFCEEGAFTVAECRRLFEQAKLHGLTPRIHAEQRTRSGGARLAAEVHAASADHLEHANDDDLRALATAGVTGVLLPGASLVLDGPPPPGRRLLDAGAVAAIATDCNPGTCYSESMALMTSLAVSLAGLTPAEALVAATFGGAVALRRYDRGRLLEGLRCDVIILTGNHWVETAYHLGGQIADIVIRGGRVVVRDGNITA